MRSTEQYILSPKSRNACIKKNIKKENTNAAGETLIQTHTWYSRNIIYFLVVQMIPQESFRYEFHPKHVIQVPVIVQYFN